MIIQLTATEGERMTRFEISKKSQGILQIVRLTLLTNPKTLP